MSVPLEYTKDWCMKMAALEGDQEIGAGVLVANIPAEILGKRIKQLSKGYDAAHDDKHGWPQLAFAAAAYAINHRELWPFADGFNAENIDVRDRLLEAAAMMVAAIESYDRTEAIDTE